MKQLEIIIMKVLMKKNYKIKKLENEKLKDEISRLKEEIINLLNEMNIKRKFK